MKQQQFRFKLIALGLIALLGAALVFGFRGVSLTEPSGDLRSAILRLTGQETASPPPGASASPVTSGSPLAATSPGIPGSSVSPEVSPAPSPGQELSTLGLGQIGPAASPAPSPLPLSEALSGYFSVSESPGQPGAAETSPAPEAPAFP